MVFLGIEESNSTRPVLKRIIIQVHSAGSALFFLLLLLLQYTVSQLHKSSAFGYITSFEQM